MRFSILVPVYQVEKYLPECIDSIRKQTFSDYEVILVDDGSRDMSGKICDQYAAIDTRVRVIHKQNEGLLLARRTAIGVATGDYLVFVDSDDMMEQDELDKINTVLEMYNSDIVLFNAYLYCDGKKKIFFKDLFEERVYSGQEKKIFLSRMAHDFAINGMWLKAVRREIIDKENDYRHCSYVSNGEDLLQSIALFDRMESIYYLNQALYNYRINNQSMTQNYSKNYFISFKYAFQSLVTCLQKNALLDRVNDAYVLFINRVFEDIVQSCGKKSPLKYKEKICHLKSIAGDECFQNAYFRVKDTNPFKRSKVGFKLLSAKLFASTILYVNIWEKLCRKQ